MVTKKEEEAVAVTEYMLEHVKQNGNEYLGSGSVIFPCPRCGESKIKRTFYERKIATKYRCNVCGFEGPN